MPEQVSNFQYAAMLKYSRHAIMAAQGDRYGKINLPKVIDSRNATLIEIEIKDSKVTKAVFRTPHDDKHDLSLAIVPEIALVKTVWLNRRDDEHSTLRKEKYATT